VALICELHRCLGCVMSSNFGLVAPKDHRIVFRALNNRIFISNHAFCAVSFLKYEIHRPPLKINTSGSPFCMLLGLRCCSRCSMSEVHLMGPSMPVCLSCNIGAGGPIVGIHFCATVGSKGSHCCATTAWGNCCSKMTWGRINATPT
jgi:hypothetical protein